ncbi:membrane protein [Microbacterium phage SBlackberry]|nr:membrane protein [Microbacterium phage SBlackberry]
MPIHIVLALLCVVAACSIFLGFAAGRGFRREDRLKAQARAWNQGFRTADKIWEETYDLVTPDEDRTSDENPYATELEKMRNA